MLKKIFKWRNVKHQNKIEEKLQSRILQPHILFVEHIIFWRTPSLSLFTMAGTNFIFFVYVHLQIRSLGLLFGLSVIAVAIGGILARRSVIVGCQQQEDYESVEHSNLVLQWLGFRILQLKELRDENRDKFCLEICLILSGLVLLGGVLNVSTLVYLATQGALLLPIALPHIQKGMRYIKQNVDSDDEMESFMPELSEQSLAELELVDAPIQSYSQEQIIEKWIPAECIPGDDSDSKSDEMSVFDNGSNAELSHQMNDSSGSSDDEFTPHSMPSHIEDQPMLLKSSVTIVQPAVNTWSVGELAYKSGLGNLSNLGAAIGAWWPGPALTTHKLIRSDSDDFEIIDADDSKTQ